MGVSGGGSSVQTSPRSTMERTYIMVKPDGVQRGLVGRVIARFEDKGMRLVGLKMVMAEDDILEEHYAELKVAE